MKNYEVEIKQIERTLSSTYSLTDLERIAPRTNQPYILEILTVVKRLTRNLQIMKSKQILFNMQNGAR